MSALYFSDAFGVSESALEKHGAFNVSLVVDLPLFIDPFLLFNSQKAEYQSLHAQIIDYLTYLRDLAVAGEMSQAGLRNLFCFSEVKQTWLGFSHSDNSGRGLGMKFAHALADNLHSLFSSFGSEKITKSSHLEKLCLIREGVGRDMISDFTTNLILGYLCEYTQAFALKHLAPEMRAEFAVNRARFHRNTGTWAAERFTLPKFADDFVILTPKDILTKDDTWINKKDFIREYHEIPRAIGDAELRDRVDGYFRRMLPKNPKQKDHASAMRLTAIEFPILYDYFIRYKENHGHEAEQLSLEKVDASHLVYVRQFGELIALLKAQTSFYSEPLTSKDAAREKVAFLKDVIENKGGFRLFYHHGVPIKKEEDLQILYRLVWHKTRYDVSREVNDGRGPADFKISYGAADKTIVEMKLASNTGLRRQLENQAEIYQKASDAKSALKVIIYFTPEERARAVGILRELKIEQSPDIVLIDARNDNKPSGSKA
ncbi:MAG: hypothetical protein HYV95_09215 [Opitutae bacterium]|nr:hypothetical protein [Opitutae bacterium]